MSAAVRADPMLAAELTWLELWVLGPRRADGIFVPCSTLMRAELDPDDLRLESLGHAELAMSDAASGATLEGVSAGEGRVVYVEAGSSGLTLASGCVEGVTVEPGVTTSVEVVLYRVR